MNQAPEFSNHTPKRSIEPLEITRSIDPAMQRPWTQEDAPLYVRVSLSQMALFGTLAGIGFTLGVLTALFLV